MEHLWNRYVYWPRFVKRRIVTALKYAIPSSMRYVPPFMHPYFVPVVQLCYARSGDDLRKAYFANWVQSRTIFLAPNPDDNDYSYNYDNVEYVHGGRSQVQQPAPAPA